MQGNEANSTDGIALLELVWANGPNGQLLGHRIPVRITCDLGVCW